MEWNVQQDAGRSLENATKVLQLKHPEWHNTIAKYYGEWETMLNGPIHETVKIFKTIKDANKYKIYALTNWSAETFPIAIERYDFLKWFNGIVVSGIEKCIKPDPKIYNIILERYNLIAEECLFIDDNTHNVQGAKSLGIEAIHFESPDQLDKQLKIIGVL